MMLSSTFVEEKFRPKTETEFFYTDISGIDQNWFAPNFEVIFAVLLVGFWTVSYIAYRVFLFMRQKSRRQRHQAPFTMSK